MSGDIPRTLDVRTPEAKPWVGNLKVEVDGVDVSDICVAYDQDFGTAEVYVLSKTGHHRFNKDRSGLITAEMRGDVSVGYK